MAYTITTIGSDATAVGTSGSDSLTDVSTFDTLKVNSFQGNDVVIVDNSATLADSTVGMGGGIDVFSYLTDGSEIAVTMGDGADVIRLDAFGVNNVTVGGQGGADFFDFSSGLSVSGNSTARFAGGQGQDTFTGYFSAYSGGVTLVGGSEDDTFDFTDVWAYSSNSRGGSVFINGQVGEDTITITDFSVTDLSSGIVRGGSEDDTFEIDVDFVDITDDASAAFYGDNGNDEIVVTGTDGYSVFGGEGDDVINTAGEAVTISGGAGSDAYQAVAGTGGSVDNTQAFDDLFADNNVIDFSDVYGAVDGVQTKFIEGFDSGDTFVMDDTWDTALDGTEALSFADNVTYFATGFILGNGTFRVDANGVDAVIYTGGNAGTSVDASTETNDFYLVSDASGLSVSSFEFDL